MLSITYGVLQNQADAEDAVQKALIDIWHHLDKFENLSNEETIKLLTIYTVNAARDIYRKRARQSTQSFTYQDDEEVKEFDIPHESADVDNIILSNEYAKEIAILIDSLPETDRHIIILKYLFVYKEREISKILRISESAVSTRINRIKKRLRKELEEDISDK